MRTAIALVLLVFVSTPLWAAEPSSRSPRFPGVSISVYDENPSHIWNRLYAALRVREDPQANKYGEDSLDPMLWRETEHLLSQPSAGLALRTMNEFLRTRAETFIQSPLKHAMLQHDLWAVFDWSVQQYSARDRPRYGTEKRELQSRLAEVLRRLALTKEQIKSLPNNYAQAVASGAFSAQYDPAHPEQPFLPQDLFGPRGPWVCITPSPEIGNDGVAKLHVSNLSGRSVFLIFVRLPAGRQATFDYFQTLWNFPQPWAAGPQLIVSDQSIPNPDLPSFPAGTQVALVRQMMLFDKQGNLVLSPITESVQIRVYREITMARKHDFSAGRDRMARNSGQDFFEITISRPLLFSGKQGGLRATGREEREFPTFQTMGNDPIDSASGRVEHLNSQPPTMETCLNCHSGGGVTSFNSLDSLLKPTRRQQEPKDVNYGPRYWSESKALWWKENRYDWGLLNGYWNAQP
jgi:hypothetical protein